MKLKITEIAFRKKKNENYPFVIELWIFPLEKQEDTDLGFLPHAFRIVNFSYYFKEIFTITKDVDLLTFLFLIFFLRN